MIGIDENDMVIDDKYKKAVLSRNKNPLQASLDWLTENQVIDADDVESFERIRTTRNLLAHELPAMVMGAKNLKHTERFQELVALLKKIEVWWVVNMEIPTNPDFDGQEIDEEGIVPGPVLMIQMMLEVLSGNEELLKHYKANSNVATGL
ncbi:hypothetical protein ACWWD9_12515 [Methylovorus sp. SPW-M1]